VAKHELRLIRDKVEEDPSSSNAYSINRIYSSVLILSDDGRAALKNAKSWLPENASQKSDVFNLKKEFSLSRFDEKSSYTNCIPT